MSCVDVTPDQTTHQNKKLANASCFQFRWLHHWASSNTELVTCTARRSKICFGQFLWRVQGKRTWASPRNYSPCPEKTGACYSGYWAGCPIFLSFVVSFEWMVVNSHCACLETGWWQINLGGVVCLSSVSCITKREWWVIWADSSLYQL